MPTPDVELEISEDGSVLTFFRRAIETQVPQILGHVKMDTLGSLDGIVSVRSVSRGLPWWNPVTEWRFERMAVAALMRLHLAERAVEEQRKMRAGEGVN